MLFTKSFFTRDNYISRQKVLQLLQYKNLPKINDDLSALCKTDITEAEVKLELNNMEINKPSHKIILLSFLGTR